MATYLFAFTRLKRLYLFYESVSGDNVLSRKADGPPPPARSVLYTFATMVFTEVSDDLVAWIDAHLLDKSDITVTFSIKYSTLHGSPSSAVTHQ
jgi:hypothetical protein